MNKKNKIIIGGSLAGLVLILIISSLFIFSGDHPNEGNKDPKENPGTSKQAKSGKVESSFQNIPLLGRIPKEAGAVILIRINDILQKGESDIISLLPPDVPPIVGNVIKNPSSIGLDVSEPLQIHVIPNENVNLPPIIGIAGKLSDGDQFINTFQLLTGQQKPAENQGYRMYEKIDDDGKAGLAVGSDFFFLSSSDNPAKVQPAIENFMSADGSNGLVSTIDEFARFTKEKHDLCLWFGGDSILNTVGSSLDNTSLDTLRGGSGTVSLNFKKGEMTARLNIQVPNNQMVYGRGGFSAEILSLTPQDAIFALGFAFDISKFMEFAEKDVLAKLGNEINLDEPIPEMGGITVRNAIGSFTGELVASLTDLKMPKSTGKGNLSSGSPSGAVEENPFGDIGIEDTDAPFPGTDGTETTPPGGMESDEMMMASMPKPEFIIAASINTEKWLRLKAAPPLAMGLGLAMLQGYSITEKDNFLILASKDHIEAGLSGSVASPVAGNSRSLFKENDFLLKINVPPLLKMNLPDPIGGPKEMLEKISFLEIASNSGKTGGSGIFRLATVDKDQNSLSIIIDMVRIILTMNAENPISGDAGNEFD